MSIFAYANYSSTRNDGGVIKILTRNGGDPGSNFSLGEEIKLSIIYIYFFNLFFRLRIYC